MNPKIIISINAYRYPALKRVIESCKKHVKDDFVVVLNNSVELNKTINKEDDYLSLNKNIICNPDCFNKRRFHGSITKGIVSNIDFALNNFNSWEQLIVLSNHTHFIKDVCIEELNDYSIKWTNNWRNKEDVGKLKDKKGWHWPHFKNTKLAKHFWEGVPLWGYHEGMTLDKKSCVHINEFFKKEKEIAENLFKTETCVEEFALHTIAINGPGNFCPMMWLNYVKFFPY
jgi:hypothetical protein